MTDLPFMALFTEDYEGATAHLTLEEDGAYNRLLRLCWRTPGCSVPDDQEWIRRKMRVTSDQYEGVIAPLIDEFFTKKKGRVFQKRQQQIFYEAKDLSSKRSNAGKKGVAAKRLKNNEINGSKADDLLQANTKQTPSKASASIPTSTLNKKEDLFSGQDNPVQTKIDYGALFLEWWALYPNKTGKKPCLPIYQRILKSGEATHEQMIGGLQAYLRCDKVQSGYIQNPQTWLNGGHWGDTYAPARNGMNGNSVLPEQVSPDRWRGRINNFNRDCETWSRSWGPKPNEPGCYAPAEVLKQFQQTRTSA